MKFRIQAPVTHRQQLGRPGDERGVTSVIVAVVVGSLAMVLLMWVATWGDAFFERRQLQNGADATSLALAQICATDASACGPSSFGDLAGLVSDNARASALEGDQVCAMNFPSATFGPCGPGDVSEMRQCPPVSPGLSGVAYVETYTSGDSPRWFSSDGDLNLQSCARAAWGPPSASSFKSPITISLCEWQEYTNGGTVWTANPPEGAWPGYGPANPPPPPATKPNTAGHELILYLHKDTGKTCPINGKDTAGGFGYLDSAGSCEVSMVATDGIDTWANIDPGNNATNACEARLKNAWENGPVIDLPIFDCLIRSDGPPTLPITAYPNCSGAAAGGAKSWYHIYGVAKFYLSGYRIGGSQERASRVSGSVPCTGGERCLSGWFVKGTLDSPGATIDPSAPDLGVSLVKPAG